MASASDHRAHAVHQPADCLILLPQRLPAAVETSIGPAHYPPSAPSQTRSFNRACAPVTGEQTLIRFVPPGAINWNDADDNNAFHAKQIVMDLDGTISTEVAVLSQGK